MKYVDMIARFGTGSAHPGGFSATVAQLERYPIDKECSILEIGCGTGRTACHLASQGHRVTAVDIHPTMLKKAKQRADAMGVDVAFAEADACRLPFTEHSFDVVLVESVTVFVDAAKASGEYYRVLRNGGVLYDRELALTRPISKRRLKKIADFFDLEQLLMPDEWIHLMHGTGFRSVDLLETESYAENVIEERTQHYDPFETVDENAFQDGELWRLAFEYSEIISDNMQDLSYVLLRSIK